MFNVKYSDSHHVRCENMANIYNNVVPRLLLKLFKIVSGASFLHELNEIISFGRKFLLNWLYPLDDSSQLISRGRTAIIHRVTDQGRTLMTVNAFQFRHSCSIDAA